MHTILKRLKIFGLAFSIMSSNILLLGGCSRNANQNIYFEKINDNDDYSITMDDVVLTINERGFTTNSFLDKLHHNLVDNLLNNDIGKSLFSKKLLSFLNIELYYQKVFTSDVIAKEVSIHSNNLLYDSVNNDIYWDKLFDVVKSNNEKNSNYESLNDNEILTVINYFHKFVDKVKEDIPNFNMETLACHLFDLSLCFNDNSDNFDAYAITSSNGLILFQLYDGRYPDFDKMDDILYHEFKHFISFSCIDEKDANYGLACTGISVTPNEVYKHLPFRWDFLEEANAEDYSTSLMGGNPRFYPTNRYLLDTIEMVNSFSSSNYGSINEFSILHNPIAILQQFLVLGDLPLEQQLWLKQNLIMLECYDLDPEGYLLYALNYEKKFDLSIIPNFSYNRNSNMISNKEYNQCVYTFLEEANLQLLRLGIGGLSLVNENRKYPLSLDDLLYLLKLLEYRMNQYDLIVVKNFELTSDHTDDYKNKYEEIITLYLNYLQNLYKGEDIYDKYINFDINSYYLSDAFTESEKEKITSLFHEISFDNCENDYFYKELGCR